MIPVPAYWMTFLTQFIGVNDQIAKRLWQVYQPTSSATLRWQLSLCSACPTVERQATLFTLMGPQALVAASEQLCAPGKRRRPEVIALQEAILARTSATGDWLYMRPPHRWRLL